MGASSMIITAANITNFEGNTANASSELNTTITEITTTIDALLETATGHDHDGTNSKIVSAGIGDITTLQLAVARIMGGMA